MNYTIILFIAFFITSCGGGGNEENNKPTPLNAGADKAVFINDKNNSFTQQATGGLQSSVITYQSSNPNIATVDENGKVTILRKGATTITAQIENNNYDSDSYQLIVKNPLNAGADKVVFAISYSFTQEAIVELNSGTGVITYQSSDENIATVDENGKVTILTTGIAIITATRAEDDNYHKVSDSYKLTVKNPLNAGADKTVFINDKNNSFTQQATGMPQSSVITYQSSDENIATVDENGKVTILKIGVTIITASIENNNYSNSYQLTVKNPLNAGTDKSVFSIPYSFTQEAIAELNSGTGVITYQSSDENVATVDENGNVTILTTGITIITATRAEDDNYHKVSDSYKLTVYNKDNTYLFKLNQDSLYEIQLDVNSCSDKINDYCCYLVLNNVVNNNVAKKIQSTIADDDGIVRLIIDEKQIKQPNDDTQSIRVVVGSTSCRSYDYNPPTITEITSSSAINTITTQGQTEVGTGRTYPDLSITTINNRNYLYDISRRGANKLNEKAVIATLRSVRASAPYLYKYRTHNADVNQPSVLNTEGIDSHAGSLIVYDYLQTLGRNSYDNQGSSMLSHTHQYDPHSNIKRLCEDEITQKGTSYNAYWDGRGVVYTKKRQPYPVSLAASLDVVAHEWAHGITNSEANLKYEKESGAINEGFSDWFAAAVDHSQGFKNWTIGEGAGARATFRSLKNPKLYKDPDTYKGEYWTNTDDCTPNSCNDNCGVHSNSGVANKMFYLLANGGEHNGIIVVGIGIDKAMRIALDAMTSMWTKTTNFAYARKGMEDVAKENYGDDAYQQVRLAWQAVKVNLPDSEPEQSTP